MHSISFFNQDINFEITQDEEIKNWILQIIQREGHSIQELNFILCSDEYLHKINIEYLDHDTFTDIITFDNSESDDAIEGDIFISIERVKENAKKFNNEFLEEFHRVVIHGILHLLGFKDKTEQEASQMRQKENEALQLLLH